MNTQLFFCNLLLVARLERLISIKTKEYFIWPPLYERGLCRGVIEIVSSLSMHSPIQFSSKLLISQHGSYLEDFQLSVESN